MIELGANKSLRVTKFRTGDEASRHRLNLGGVLREVSSWTSIITTDVMLFAAKKLPLGIGTAVELVETINNSHKKYHSDLRLSSIEYGTNSITSSIQGVLDNLGKPQQSIEETHRQFNTLDNIQTSGWEPTLFEGLLRNSADWDGLKRRPRDYGDVLESSSKLHPGRIRIILDLDETRVLELTPYALSKLLSNQMRGIPRTKVILSEDMWAFRENGHSLTSTITEASIQICRVRQSFGLLAPLFATLKISLNNVDKATLRNNSTSQVNAEPGSHELKIRNPLTGASKSLIINLLRGETQYYEVSIMENGGGVDIKEKYNRNYHV